MICNSNARNNGKLLAAIVAMLMVACAVAVVAIPGDAEGTATSADTSISYGETVEMNQAAWNALKATGESNKTSTYYPTQKVLKLDSDQTWQLTGNIEDSDITLDLNGHNLKIIGDFTLTLTNNSSNDNTVDGSSAANISALDNNGDNNSNLMIDGSTVTFIANGTRTGGVWAVDADKLSQVYLVNGAILNAQKTATSAVTGTVWHGAGGVTVVFLDASTINFSNAHTNGSGVASTAIFAYNGSTVDATGLAGGSMSIYADIRDSKLNANVLGLYAANIAGESTVTANTLGVYTGASDAGFTGFTTNQVSIDAESSVTADTILNSLTTGTAAGTDSVVFTGKGSLSGTFTEIAETESNYQLNGVTLTGSSAIGSGASVSIGTDGVSVTGNLRNNGNLDTTEGSLDVSGRFTNNGTVNGANPITGSGQVTNNGEMNAPVESSNYTNNNSSELTVYGDSTGTQWYPQRQNITVPEGQTWTIISGNIIVIPGTLNVLGNLVIEEGGVLIIGGVGYTGDNSRNGVGKAIIEGTLTVEEGGVLAIAYGNVDINGTASIDGYVMAGSKLSKTITEAESELNTAIVSQDIDAFVASNFDDSAKSASLNVNSDTSFSEYSTVSQGTSGSIAVATDVVLTLEGKFSSAVTINNSGSVVIDSEPLDVNNQPIYCDKVIDIAMLADGASVEIRNLAIQEGGNVNISDLGLVIDRDGNKIGTADENLISINSGTFVQTGDVYYSCVISGLTVVENFDGVKKVSGQADKILNTMDLSGDLSVSAQGDNAKSMFVWPVKGDFTVSDDGDAAALSIGEDVFFSNGATIVVSGYVPVSADTTFENARVTAGTITLAGNGHIYMAKQTINGGTLNAAFYETTENAVDYSNYVTVDTAIAAANANTAIDEIALYGKNTVTVSATVPAIDFTFENDAALNIGTTDSRDVVLTIAAGASYNGTGTTDVKGTLYFNDRTNLKMDESTIDADVVSKQVGADGKEVKNGWAKYTNIYTAMDEAVAGDVINVFQDAKVELDRDFTVKEGVTLVVNDEGAQIVVKNGVTLTVAGTLQSEASAEGIIAQTKFATKAANDQVNDNYASAIVVTGTLKAVETVDYGTADGKTLATSKISGAYYTDGEYNYVTPMSVAVSESMLPTIESDITVYGTVSEGDTVFNATDMCGTITVAADAKLTLSSLTLGNEAVFDVNASGLFTGTVTVGDASIAAVNIKGASIDSANGLTLGDVDVTNTNKDGKLDASLNVAAGTVVLDGTVTGNMTVDAGATLTVPSAASSDKRGVVVGNLAVDGTVAIGNGQALDVLNNTNTQAVEGNLYVDGTVTVAAATDTASAGGLTAAKMYVGLSDKFATTGTGTVTGDVAVDLIYAVNGATVDAATTNGMSTTAYYVEGTVWINAYANGDKDLIVDEMKNAPVENAYFNNVWQNEVGDTKYSDAADTDNGIETSTIGTPTAVYAVIEYDIYVINMRADQNAVSSVTIDGNLMQQGMVQGTDGNWYYGFTAVVSAGSHTISYQLANGYSGNGVLTVNGTQQSGLTFTTEGNPTDDTGKVTYNLQLTGFEKSGYVPDSPDTPSDTGGNDGMTITDYLLIVLVVLIIVMAIIVAMRLMRS